MRYTFLAVSVLAVSHIDLWILGKAVGEMLLLMCGVCAVFFVLECSKDSEGKRLLLKLLLKGTLWLAAAGLGLWTLAQLNQTSCAILFAAYFLWLEIRRMHTNK